MKPCTTCKERANAHKSFVKDFREFLASLITTFIRFVGAILLGGSIVASKLIHPSPMWVPEFQIYIIMGIFGGICLLMVNANIEEEKSVTA